MNNSMQECLDQGLHTERLLLRKLRLDDAGDMFLYTASQTTCQYLNWGPHQHKEEAEAFIRKVLKKYAHPGEILWGIEERSERKLIGVLRIYNLTEDAATLSYILNEQYTGKGYMTEAVRAAIQVCFDRLGLHSVYADYIEENQRSKRVMERCGMMPSEGPAVPFVIKGKATLLHRYVIKKEEKKA